MSTSLLSPEARLLLLAISSSRSPEALLGALRDPGLDWSRLVVLADREKATAPLWGALRDLPEGSVPAERALQLGRLAAIGDFRMLRHEQRLAGALATLREAGIEAVLLKGAGLAATVYGSFTERPMYDLDLLVREDQATRAWDALRRAEWTHDEAACPPDLYEGHHHLPPLDDPGGTGLSLELHTRPWAGAVELSIAEIWRRSRPIEVKGEPARVLCVTHQVIHLAAHFAWTHALQSAAWRTIRDLRYLLDTGEVDWDELVPAAVETRSATCCYWTFAIARALADVHVPERVLRALRPPLPAAVRGVLERHYIGALFHFSPARCPSLRVGRMMWAAGIAPRWSGHGPVRPWDRDADWEALTRTAGPFGLRDRLRSHLAGAAGWASYLRSLLAAPLAPTESRLT